MNIPTTLQALIIGAAGQHMAQAMANAHMRAFKTHPEDMHNAITTAAKALCFEAIKDGVVDFEEAAKAVIAAKLDEVVNLDELSKECIETALADDVDLDELSKECIETAVERIGLTKIVSDAESNVQGEVTHRLNQIDVTAMVREELAEHIAQPATHVAVVMQAGKVLAEHMCAMNAPV